MAGRRIVITGANRGIGLATTRRLIEQGHTVWGACRNPDGADELRALGPAGILHVDIADGEAIGGFADALAAETDAIDTLINNAGLNADALGGDHRQQGPFAADRATVLGQIDANAIGPMQITARLQPLLHAGNAPVVLNVSSQLGSMVVGAQVPFDVGYNGSKAVLNMITVMSATVDPDVTYLTVHPGYVRTDMGGPTAAISPEESAAGICDILTNVTPADTGRFLRWDGTEHPW